MASTQSYFAYAAMLAGHIPEARQNLEASAALLDQLRVEKPDDAELLNLAASVATRRGDLTEYEGHPRDGLAFFQEAHQLATEYARAKPENGPRMRLYLAKNLLATALVVNERFDEALTMLRQADPIIIQLLAAEPDNPVYRRNQMSAAGIEGAVYDDLNRPAEAVVALRRYVALAQRMVDADSNNASARLSLAIANYTLSAPLGKTDPAEALRVARRAIEILDEDLARDPKSRLLRSRRARGLRHLAYALERNGRHVEARKAVTQAIAIQQQLLAETPSDASERDQLTLSKKALDGLGAP